jgi:hypothetical protein
LTRILAAAYSLASAGDGRNLGLQSEIHPVATPPAFQVV